MNIVLLTNILTPFRIYFYDKLYKEFFLNGHKFTVLVMVPREPGRKWEYDNYRRDYTQLMEGKLFKVSGIDVIINPKIKRHIRILSPEIMICAGSYMLPSVWKAIRYSRKLDYKIFYWSETHLNEKRLYGKYKIILRSFFRNMIIPKFDGFWFAGKMSKEFIDKYAALDSYFVFVPNLVEEKAYFKASLTSAEEKKEFRKINGIGDGKKILLCPARLSKEKGIVEFLELLNKCKNKREVIILISGNGPLKEQIENLAKQHEIDVRLLGFQNQEDIVKLYGVADLFVMPSVSDSNPLTCIEASWASKPLLLSCHVGNNPEMIVEGQNGYVFNYEDESKSISIIEQFISSSEEWRKTAGKVSLKIAEDMYNSEKAIARIVKETLGILEK